MTWPIRGAGRRLTGSRRRRGARARAARAWGPWDDARHGGAAAWLGRNLDSASHGFDAVLDTRHAGAPRCGPPVEAAAGVADAERQPVVASCADLDSLLEAVDAVGPDVVVTDIRMPPTETDEGIRIAAVLRESHPNTGVLVLSQYAAPSYALALFDSGSDSRAHLLKQRVHNRAELVSAIRSVASGGR